MSICATMDDQNKIKIFVKDPSKTLIDEIIFNSDKTVHMNGGSSDDHEHGSTIVVRQNSISSSADEIGEEFDFDVSDLAILNENDECEQNDQCDQSDQCDQYDQSDQCIQNDQCEQNHQYDQSINESIIMENSKLNDPNDDQIGNGTDHSNNNNEPLNNDHSGNICMKLNSSSKVLMPPIDDHDEIDYVNDSSIVIDRSAPSAPMSPSLSSNLNDCCVGEIIDKCLTNNDVTPATADATVEYDLLHTAGDHQADDSVNLDNLIDNGESETQNCITSSLDQIETMDEDQTFVNFLGQANELVGGRFFLL